MPLQSLLVEPAFLRIDKLAQAVTQAPGSCPLLGRQGGGLMNQEMSAAAVVQEFKADFLLACERLAESSRTVTGVLDDVPAPLDFFDESDALYVYWSRSAMMISPVRPDSRTGPSTTSSPTSTCGTGRRICR
ncbi:MAG: hypothetical protein CM1200mP20_09940 [Pseudomonadota bacterium]|nr:MAG: hypothetical protein CM1200mP20_09940 [Pseudomonadota bacterium]